MWREKIRSFFRLYFPRIPGSKKGGFLSIDDPALHLSGKELTFLRAKGVEYVKRRGKNEFIVLYTLHLPLKDLRLSVSDD